MARPKIEIDAQLVEELASIGCTTKEIAAVVHCSVDTLDRRFAEVLEKGRETGKTRLRKAQWSAALDGSVPMLIWLGKQYLGQTDRADVTSNGETVKAYVGFNPDEV